MSEDKSSEILRAEEKNSEIDIPSETSQINTDNNENDNSEETKQALNSVRDAVSKSINNLNDGVEESLEKNGSIDCAKACRESSDCEDAWGYELATKRCYFYKDISREVQDMLQPSYQMQDNNKTVGWATGRKACSIPGKLSLKLL